MAKFIITGAGNFRDPVFRLVAKELTLKGIDLVVVRDEDRQAVTDLVRAKTEELKTGQVVRETDQLDDLIDLIVDLDPYKQPNEIERQWRIPIDVDLSKQ